MTEHALIALVALLLGAGIGYAPVHRMRARLTLALGEMRAQRDTAIRAVRWVPLKKHEITALSKTGCGSCHGDGTIFKPGAKGEKASMDVCKCVFKSIANRADYGALENGVVVRLATSEEVAQILPAERQDNVIGIRS